MKESSHAVIAVNDLECASATKNDNGGGESSVRPNEVCTCPHSLLCAFDICHYCRRRTVETLSQADKDQLARQIEKIEAWFDFFHRPSGFNPSRQRQAAKGVKPSRASRVLRNLCEWPSFLSRKRSKPDIEDFIRHMRKKTLSG